MQAACGGDSDEWRNLQPGFREAFVWFPLVYVLCTVESGKQRRLHRFFFRSLG